MSAFKVLLKSKNIKAGGFYLFGNLFDKAIIFLTIPIFTRLMSPDDFGLFNTYMACVSILMLIVGLSLGSSLRSAYIDYKDTFEEYIASILFLSVINFLVTATCIIFYFQIFFNQINITLVILCLIQSFMTYIISTMIIKYMMILDYVKRTVLLAIPNILTTLISILLIINMENNLYLGRIFPYVLITTIIGTYYLLRYLLINGRKILNIKYWKYALGLSIPLIFHGLSINILNVSDRLMITYFRGANETGIYSLVYSFSMIALVLTTSLGSVWIPWFNNKLQNGEKNRINKVVTIYIEIIVIVIISLLLIGPEILKIMAPSEYWGGKVIIAPILLASFFIFLYSISVDLEYYYKSTAIIAKNTIIAALLNILLNLIFIPQFGYLAAAYTTVIAFMVSFLIHYFSARRLDNQLFPFTIYIKPILMILISICFFNLFIDKVLIRWLTVIIGLILYLLIIIIKKRYKLLM